MSVSDSHRPDLSPVTPLFLQEWVGRLDLTPVAEGRTETETGRHPRVRLSFETERERETKKVEGTLKGTRTYNDAQDDQIELGCRSRPPSTRGCLQRITPTGGAVG